MELWIARDYYSQELHLYKNEPTIDYNDRAWEDRKDIEGWYYIDADLFPEITFENSPKKIKIELL